MTVPFNNILSRNEKFTWRWLVLGLFALCSWLPAQEFVASTVTIYSHRQNVVTQPILGALNKTTGVESKSVIASKGLGQRLRAEGTASLPNFITTVDITRLAEHASWDSFAPDEVPVERLEELATDAQMIIDRVRW